MKKVTYEIVLFKDQIDPRKQKLNTLKTELQELQQLFKGLKKKVNKKKVLWIE